MIDYRIPINDFGCKFCHAVNRFYANKTYCCVRFDCENRQLLYRIRSGKPVINRATGEQRRAKAKLVGGPEDQKRAPRETQEN